MTNRRIIARDYRGKALIRFLVKIGEKSVSITDSEGVFIVEFPPNDIFEYPPNISDGATDADWGKLIPIKSTQI